MAAAPLWPRVKCQVQCYYHIFLPALVDSGSLDITISNWKPNSLLVFKVTKQLLQVRIRNCYFQIHVTISTRRIKIVERQLDFRPKHKNAVVRTTLPSALNQLWYYSIGHMFYQVHISFIIKRRDKKIEVWKTGCCCSLF